MSGFDPKLTSRCGTLHPLSPMPPPPGRPPSAWRRPESADRNPSGVAPTGQPRAYGGSTPEPWIDEDDEVGLVPGAELMAGLSSRSSSLRINRLVPENRVGGCFFLSPLRRATFVPCSSPIRCWHHEGADLGSRAGYAQKLVGIALSLTSAVYIAV